MIAAHYVAAYEAAPDAEDALEIRAKASDALTRAGERARALAASAEEMRYLRRAAELTEDPGGRGMLLDRAGQAALRANAPTEARELLESAHELIAADDAQTAALVTARLAELDWLDGHPQSAVARLEPALEALSGRESEAQLAEVAGQLGRFLILSGEFERGAVYVEQALGIAELLDLPEVLSHSLNSKATIAANAGRPNEARILLEGALAIALEHDLHAAALRAYNNLGWALETQDRLREANDVSRRAAEYARRIGDRGIELNFLCANLHTLYVLGEWDEVLARAEELVEYGRHLPDAVEHARRPLHHPRARGPRKRTGVVRAAHGRSRARGSSVARRRSYGRGRSCCVPREQHARRSRSPSSHSPNAIGTPSRPCTRSWPPRRCSNARWSSASWRRPRSF